MSERMRVRKESVMRILKIKNTLQFNLNAINF